MPPNLSEEFGVDAVKEALESSTAWTGATPTIEYLWGVSPSERGPGADQPPEIYVWSPIDTNIERFSADATFNDTTETVEVVIFSLESDNSGQENKQYQRDVLQILGDYANDNEANSVFTDIRAESSEDRRNEKIATDTSHFVTVGEFTTRGLFNAQAGQ